MKNYFALILIILSACSPTAKYDVYEENDYFNIGQKNNDHQYTQGLEFKYSDGDTSYTAGQQIYTPGHKQLTTPQLDDRPYAAWLYGGAEKRISRNEFSQDVLSLKLGMVGPAALGGPAQNGVHRLIGIPTAKGWDTQIHNEPGILARGERQYINFTNTFLGYDFDNLSGLGADLGNIKTDGFLGTTFRYGTGLPGNFGPSIIPRAGKPIIKDNITGFFFIGANGKAVARDIFLDGNTFEDSQSISKEPILGDIRFGVSAAAYGFRVTYTMIFASAEFKNEDGSHGYGSINIGFDN